LEKKTFEKESFDGPVRAGQEEGHKNDLRAGTPVL